MVIAFRVSYAVMQTARRTARRPDGDAERTLARGRLLLRRGHADLSGRRPSELLRLPLPPRRGGGRQLARRPPRPYPSGSRGASVAGPSPSSTAAPPSERPSPLPSSCSSSAHFGELAARVRGGGRARLRLAPALAPELPPAGDAPSPERRGAGDDPGRPPRRSGDVAEAPPVPRHPGGSSFGMRQTWGAIAARGLTDPVWFMIADWFAVYLVGQGLSSSKRRRPGSGCRSSPPTSATSSAAASRAISSGEGGPWDERAQGGDRGRRPRCTRSRSCRLPVVVSCPRRLLRRRHVLVRGDVHHGDYPCPADLFHSRAVATVSGLAGHGRRPRDHRLDVSDRRDCRPVLLHAHPRGGERRAARSRRSLVFVLVRNTEASGQGLVQGDLSSA